jgi:hypothetical protein
MTASEIAAQYRNLLVSSSILDPEACKEDFSQEIGLAAWCRTIIPIDDRHGAYWHV